MLARLAEEPLPDLMSLLVVVLPMAIPTTLILLLAFLIAWVKRDEPNASD